MKKLMYLCFGIFWFFISLLLFFNFSLDSFQSIYEQKTPITIEKKENTTNKEFLESLNSIFEELDEDIMYQTLEVKDNTQVYEIYITQNTDNFLSSIINTDTALDENTIYSNFQTSSQNVVNLGIPNIFYKVNLSKLTKAEKFNLDSANFYIRESSSDRVIKRLQDDGYNVSIVNLFAASNVGFSIWLLCGLPIFILCLSIIIYILSNAKSNIVKKLDGLSSFNIILLEIKEIFKIFAIIFISIELLNFLTVFILYKNAVVSYAKYSLKDIIISIIIICLVFICSNAIVFFQKSSALMKGKSFNKQIFFFSTLGKVAFSLFLISSLSSVFTNINSLYNLYVTEKSIMSTISGYVTFPVYDINNSYTNDKDILEKLESFYYETEEKYQGVLIDSNNYGLLPNGHSVAEEFNQNFIIINQNYLKINPINKPDGSEISSSDFDLSLFNIMIPESMSENEVKEDMASHYFDTSTLNIIKYKDNSRIMTFNADRGNNNFGQINNPVIWLFDKKFIEKEYFEEFFSLSYYFAKSPTEDAYSSFYPEIKKYKLENIMLETPYIINSFSDNIQSLYLSIIIGLIPAIIYLVCILVLIIFMTRLFCETYIDKIASKKLNGFSFFDTYIQYIVVLGVTSFINIAFSIYNYLTSNTNASIIISLSIILVEVILFFIISRKYTRKVILETLKGN